MTKQNWWRGIIRNILKRKNMSEELATRLYNSAERAVKAQFPHLPSWQYVELIIDELVHRYGVEKAEEIIFKAV